MNIVTPVTRTTQRLNHVEFVHRPGERALVHALFDLLNFQTIEVWEGEIVIGIIDPPTFDEADNDNVITGREVRPEQWAFDQALANAFTREPLAVEFESYKATLALNPQWGMHFGIHLSSLEKWQSAVTRLSEIEKHAPQLKGRAELIKIMRPGDPDQRADLCQAFLWTDVISASSLALGQRIELSAFPG
jgi:hypothetical protein